MSMSSLLVCRKVQGKWKIIRLLIATIYMIRLNKLIIYDVILLTKRKLYSNDVILSKFKHVVIHSCYVYIHSDYITLSIKP